MVVLKLRYIYQNIVKFAKYWGSCPLDPYTSKAGAIAVGNKYFRGCKISILPKSNQICPNLIIFAQISF